MRTDPPLLFKAQSISLYSLPPGLALSVLPTGFRFPLLRNYPYFAAALVMFPNYSTRTSFGSSRSYTVRDSSPLCLDRFPFLWPLFRHWEFFGPLFSVINESVSRSTFWSIFATCFGANFPHRPNFRSPLPQSKHGGKSFALSLLYFTLSP